MATKTRENPVAVESDSVTRESILLGAARLFRHHGYAATTLREVADAAGIKAGSIYYHFESKEQILAEVLDKGILSVIEAVRQRVEALPPDAKARDKLAAAIEGHLWGLLHHGDFTSANIRIYGQIPLAAKNRHRKIRREYADYWDALLDEALRRGELRPDIGTTISRLFVIGALNWTVEWYNPQKGSFEDFVKQITTIVFDGTFVKE
ncbi:MAG: TetR family transcriptional regulator [Rubrivivax sp. SCN 70-15]|nr:MAG: TetR family transcriptional regulator [Rubrivivax sp. SCN 70-15]